MELLWNVLSVLRLIHRSTEQVEVAGSIPPPGGCRAAELLDCSAEVEISNCKTETGKLNLKVDSASQLPQRTKQATHLPLSAKYRFPTARRMLSLIHI